MTDEPLDLLGPTRLVDRLISGQEQVTTAVRAASGPLVRAAELLAEVYGNGGRIVLAGAGTSGRLAAMEAAELPGTFGIDPARLAAQVAGSAAGRAASDDAEDDQAQGRADIAGLALGRGDVLVAVAASGTTPYTLGAAAAAREAGAPVIAVVNVAGSALAGLAEVAVELVTGPEVIEGSTRLAAGTAQKIALNTMTTAAMVLVGRVHDRFMVDVVAANAKLARRVTGLVAESCGVDEATASAALARCREDARAAIVHLLTGLPPDEAARRAAAHRTVRAAVDSVG